MAKQQSSIAKFKKQLRVASGAKPESEEKGRKKSPFFSLIDHMGGDKRPWDELTEAERNAMSQFAIERCLSSYEEYLPILNFTTQMNLRDRDFYTLMCEIMAKRKHYFKGAKKIEEDEELIRAVMHEFFYTREKAREYVEDIEPAEEQYIRNRWKDIVKEEMEK